MIELWLIWQNDRFIFDPVVGGGGGGGEYDWILDGAKWLDCDWLSKMTDLLLMAQNSWFIVDGAKWLNF